MKRPIICTKNREEAIRLYKGLYGMGYIWVNVARDISLNDLIESLSNRLDTHSVITADPTDLSFNRMRPDGITWRTIGLSESRFYTRVNSVEHFLQYLRRAAT